VQWPDTGAADPQAAPAPVTARAVTLTYDDLPHARAGAHDLAWARETTDRLLHTLQAERVPAVGFVNEREIETAESPDAWTALLEAWLDAGMELGNHTWGHPAFSSSTLEEYEAQMLRGERITRRLLSERGARPRFFRHPFLDTGPDLATRRAFESFLAEHGYRVAPVTIDNDDYVYALAYDRAAARQDSARMRHIGADYVRYMEQVFSFYEGLSHRVLGREPAQVLLLHASRLNADRDGALIAMLRRRGYRFVSLETALEDPAYRSPDEYAERKGRSWIQRWAITRGEDPGAQPSVPSWVQEIAYPLNNTRSVQLWEAAQVELTVNLLPGLKSTGRGLQADLRRLGSGASVRLGRAWTALIVAQVAVAVTVLPTAVYLGFDAVRMAAVRTTFPAHEFLTAGLGLAVPVRPGMDGEDYRRVTATRFAVRLPELERRLEAEPTVAGVTFEGRLPDRGPGIEIEGAPGPAKAGTYRVPSTGVATGYFELLGARVLAGRGFRASDTGEAGGGLIVNEAFVRTLLDGGTGKGVPGPWLEIVGVVEDLQASELDREWAPPAVYYAVAPGQLQAADLLVRVRSGEADDFAPRLRRITAALDPELRLVSVENLATLRNPRLLASIVAAVLLLLVTVVLLSAAGIHALMSLTVTRRRREIGIRAALGAHPGRLLAGIFSRAAGQLGLGALAGVLLGGALLHGNDATARAAVTCLGGIVVLMLAAGLVAALGPARRGLAIQPMEALRED
jgi:peptidoglycan/xylan/chitin deacetylase (PgdA/CDA1 family)